MEILEKIGHGWLHIKDILILVVFDRTKTTYFLVMETASYQRFWHVGRHSPYRRRILTVSLQDRILSLIVQSRGGVGNVDESAE